MSKRTITVEGALRLYLTLVPFSPDRCISCGNDPRIIWDHNYNVGMREEVYRIDHKGQLCLDCALDSAAHLARQYPSFITWRVK